MKRAPFVIAGTAAGVAGVLTVVVAPILILARFRVLGARGRLPGKEGQAKLVAVQRVG